MKKDIFDELQEKWGYPVVPRAQGDKASAYTVSRKSLANLDSLGEGPPNRQTICGKVVYPSPDFFNWLRERSGGYREND